VSEERKDDGTPSGAAEAQAEPKLSDRDLFALNKYYVRMFRALARELEEQRDLLEIINYKLGDDP
jgi:hypothetical protein